MKFEKREEMNKRMMNKVEISIIKDRNKVRSRQLVLEVVIKCSFRGE